MGTEWFFPARDGLFEPGTPGLAWESDLWTSGRTELNQFTTSRWHQARWCKLESLLVDSCALGAAPWHHPEVARTGWPQSLSWTGQKTWEKCLSGGEYIPEFLIQRPELAKVQGGISLSFVSVPIPSNPINGFQPKGWGGVTCFSSPPKMYWWQILCGPV